jgi:uncharacterized protein
VQISGFHMIQPYLFIANMPKKGRGIFTTEKIAVGTILEIAPVIVMKLSDKEYLDKTLLHDYIFMWGENEEKCCMALGWIPLYNHSYESNCEYKMNFTINEMQIVAIRTIAANEEITINYNGEWNAPEKVWFDVV